MNNIFKKKMGLDKLEVYEEGNKISLLRHR